MNSQFVVLSFIDGTVAGTDISTGNTDRNPTHDHTYYGNGCPDKDGGYAVSCTTRIVKDGDGEDQKNGTYYTFQAATTGTGGAITTQNANSSDTFCPLGWQLPYSGTGGDYYNKFRSWRKLFDIYNITYDDGDVAQVTKMESYPFSYIHSGYYFWGTGRLYNQRNNGYYWSSTVVDNTSAYFLYTLASAIRPADMNIKTRGFAIRCVKFLAFHHRRHGGRNTCRFNSLYRYLLWMAFARSFLLWKRV